MACSLPGADDVFGPVVLNCRSGFDFTLLFEQSVLTIIPAALLLIATPIRLFQLYKTPVKAHPTAWNKIKIVFKPLFRYFKQCTLPQFQANIAQVVAGTLVILDLVLLVMWATDKSSQTRASLAASILHLIASVSIVILSSIEHPRSVRPSSLLTVYLFFSALFNIAQLRTLYLRGNLSIAAAFAAGIALKLVLLLLEAKGKRHLLKSPYDHLPKETTSGIFSRTYFLWLNTLFRKSYHSILQYQDLPAIDNNLGSEKLGRMFQDAWARRSLYGFQLNLRC